MQRKKLKKLLSKSEQAKLGNKKNLWKEETIQKVRFQIAKISSTTDVKNLFMKMDPTGQGSLSTMAFRAAIRKLNLGLTISELDQVLNFCDIDCNGDIDWQEFVKRL